MLDEINNMREMMMMSAKVTGYTSEETIHYSQELDKLIYEYQCTFRRDQKGTKDLKPPFYQMLIWPRASLISEIVYI
jgi:stage 0 sporulation regulatory protein